MSTNPANKAQRHHSARTHTSELLDMLRGRPQPPATPKTTDAPPPPPPARRTAPTSPPPPTRKRSPLNPPMLRTVGSHLEHPGKQLASLMSQANHLVFINRAFHAYIPAHCRPHATIVNVDSEAWIIHADSPAWATRLRFCLRTLRQQLSAHLRTPVPELRLRVRPQAQSQAEAPPRPRPSLSSHSAHVLEGTAQSLSDRRLSNALLRLAGRAEDVEKP